MSATIKRAEQQLKSIGYAPGKIDGVVTAPLTEAVKQFQQAWRLPVTGVIDAKTQSQIAYTAQRKASHKPGTLLSIGQKSQAIKTVENQLRKLGYDPGQPDGIYGRDTAAAVKAFRADQKELEDNHAWLSTPSIKLLATEARALTHAPERRRLAPSAAQNRVDRQTTIAARSVIDASDSGEVVKNVQRHLGAAGFSPKRANGVFDERTYAALKAFQKNSGLPVTGTVDSKTWKSLQKSFILSNHAADPAQTLGERSGAVKQTEKLLATLGYKPGKVDGLFNQGTQAAVRRFEKKQGLKVDGRMGQNELAKLKRLATSPRLAPAPPNDYHRTKWSGKTVNVRTKVMLERADQYLAKLGFKHHFTLSQGSYSPGYGPSGGTHDGGGVVDVNVRKPNGQLYSQSQQMKMVKALRMAGFAAWRRTPSDGFPYHIHAAAIGDRQSTAKWQVDEYFHGGDGLTGSRRDSNASVGRPYPDWAKKYR